MPPDPQPRPEADPRELRRAFAERQQRAGQHTEQTSGAPLAVFGACDPMVEAKLLDDVVSRLLRHMSLGGPPPAGTATPPAGSRDEAITSDEVRAVLADFEHVEQQEPPSLLEHLAQERMWILLDLARNGNGVARQRATAELRAAMDRLHEWEGVDEAVLRELEFRLAAARRADDGDNALFHVMLLATRRALTAVPHGAPTER